MMARNITIHDTTRNADDMVDLLRHVADLIEQGYTSGYYPGWDLAGEDDEPDDDDS